MDVPLPAASATAARHSFPLDGIDEFVTYADQGHELEGWTSAELEAALQRHNASVPVWSESLGAQARHAELVDAVSAAPAVSAIRAEARAYLSTRNRGPFVRNAAAPNWSPGGWQ